MQRLEVQVLILALVPGREFVETCSQDHLGLFLRGSALKVAALSLFGFYLWITVVITSPR